MAPSRLILKKGACAPARSSLASSCITKVKTALARKVPKPALKEIIEDLRFRTGHKLLKHKYYCAVLLGELRWFSLAVLPCSVDLEAVSFL